MTEVLSGSGEPIKTKARLVSGTEEAFDQIRTERLDSPPESLALLDAALVALRALRDNPLIPDGNPRVLAAMAELTYAAAAAAGIHRALVVGATTVPAGTKLH